MLFRAGTRTAELWRASTNPRKAMPPWFHWRVPCGIGDISFRTTPSRLGTYIAKFKLLDSVSKSKITASFALLLYFTLGR